VTDAPRNVLSPQPARAAESPVPPAAAPIEPQATDAESSQISILV
jgi:hypothetical protein